jgi:hypothetical protein
MGFANKRATAQSRWLAVRQLAVVVCLIVVALLLTQQQLLLTHSGAAVAERSPPSPQPRWDLEKAVREYTAVFPDYPLPLYGANDDNLCEISHFRLRMATRQVTAANTCVAVGGRVLRRHAVSHHPFRCAAV